jgi:hypothetical protein
MYLSKYQTVGDLNPKPTSDLESDILPIETNSPKQPMGV